MKQYFITHVEPVHPQKGKDVLFSIREQDDEQKIYRSHTMIQKVPYYFYTPNRVDEEIKILLDELQSNQQLQHLKFEQLRYNTRKSFLRAEGSKEDRKILPAPFLCKKDEDDHRDPCSLNSPSRQLRWLYPPFTLVESPDNIPAPFARRKGYASLESILQDTHAVLDIELEGWEVGKEHLFMAVYVSPQRTMIIHDLPFDRRKMGKAKLRRVADEAELGSVLTKAVAKDDPLWIFGHNIMNFDQIKIRQRTQNYYPGTRGQQPLTKSVQGLGKVITKGRFTLDTYAYAFYHRNIFVDNSLETLAGFEKSIDYVEQAELVRRARQGDEQAFETLVKYCLEDGIREEKLALEWKELVTAKALHFRREPDSICATGAVTVAEDAWKRRHFVFKKTHEDSWRTRALMQEHRSLDERKNLGEQFKQGLFECTLLYLTPFVAAAYPLFEKTELRKLFTTADAWTKFDLLRATNTHLTYIVEECERILKTEDWTAIPPLTDQQSSALYCLFQYHLVGMKPEIFVQNVPRMIANTKRALEQYDIINQGKLLTAVRGNPDILKLEERLYGCSLGSAQVLSMAPGKFIADVGQGKNRFVYQGIRVQKGMKSTFERRLLPEMFGRIFSGEEFSQVQKYVQQEVAAYVSGQKPIEDYVISVRRRTYFKNQLEAALPEQMKPDFEALKLRISDRFTAESRKELRQLVEKCTGEFSYPYLLEALDEIENPYPPTVECVYAAPNILLPVTMSGPDVDVYRQRMQDLLADVQEILKSKKGRESLWLM
ncbi:hypothetical protein HYX14_02100 [Candidatus Woesearchaeota archaeon]|nr:hypothetical protein [Candidatus Woesearchaeota archaeon]